VSHTYDLEYVDTFGGEANYCWVQRETVTMPDLTHYGYTGSTDGSYSKANKVYIRELVRRAKAALGLTGVRCNREDRGDTIALRPRGSCTVVFINWRDE
jgi:hypothetical protein